MLYEYKTNDGKIVLKNYKMGEAPKYITVRGRKAYRVFSSMTMIPQHMQAVQKSR